MPKSNPTLNSYHLRWTSIYDVRVLTLSTLPGIAAVPNGKGFDVVDLGSKSLLCQLRKGEVSSWFCAKAMAAGAPFNHYSPTA